MNAIVGCNGDGVGTVMELVVTEMEIIQQKKNSFTRTARSLSDRKGNMDKSVKELNQ